MNKWIKIAIGAVSLVVVYLLVAYFVHLWPFAGGDTNNGDNDGSEQVDPNPNPNPAPPVSITIEIPASTVTGEYAWTNIPADKQKLLNETGTPDLQGEKILLVHKVTGWVPGSTMYWIQTEASDGTVRNIFTDESNVVIK